MCALLEWWKRGLGTLPEGFVDDDRRKNKKPGLGAGLFKYSWWRRRDLNPGHYGYERPKVEIGENGEIVITINIRLLEGEAKNGK